MRRGECREEGSVRRGECRGEGSAGERGVRGRGEWEERGVRGEGSVGKREMKRTTEAGWVERMGVKRTEEFTNTCMGGERGGQGSDVSKGG